MWFILTLDDRVAELEKETNSNILKLVEGFFSCLMKNMISFSFFVFCFFSITILQQCKGT